MMELLEGKEITALGIMNHSYCNSEDPIMPLGTSDKFKLKITKYECTCTRMIQAAAAAAKSVYSRA